MPESHDPYSACFLFEREWKLGLCEDRNLLCMQNNHKRDDKFKNVTKESMLCERVRPEFAGVSGKHRAVRPQEGRPEHRAPSCKTKLLPDASWICSKSVWLKRRALPSLRITQSTLSKDGTFWFWCKNNCERRAIYEKQKQSCRISKIVSAKK